MKTSWLSLTLLFACLMLVLAAAISLFYQTAISIMFFVAAGLVGIAWLRVVSKEDPPTSFSEDEWIVFEVGNDEDEGIPIGSFFPRSIVGIIRKHYEDGDVFDDFYLEQDDDGVWRKHEMDSRDYLEDDEW